MNNRQGIRPALMAVAAASLLSVPPIGASAPPVAPDSNRLYVAPKRWVPNNAKEFGMSMKRQRRNHK